MKKRKFILIAGLLLLIVSILSWCGIRKYEEFIGENIPLGEQDRDFISLIKNSLKKKGDIVKVSDIHTGEWSYVCVHPISSYSNIRRGISEWAQIAIEDVEVINNVNTYADDHVWGIYFYYPPNKAEYYRIPWYEIYQTGRYFCAEKESAYFKITGDFKNREFVNLVSSVVPDFIELRILDTKKENLK